ncbi:MAG: hypothetical protein ACFFAE_01225 [Candidatus Hodarchaeota archaeon]
MRKHCITHFTLIVIFLVLILPNSYVLAESSLQKPKIEMYDDSLSKPSLALQQASNPEKTILPNTNLTVASYLGTIPEHTFNATVLSLNRSHWFIHCDYSTSLEEPSFDSIVSRTGINHSFRASNYWDWQYGNPSNAFEFWIDTTGFYDGYIIEQDSIAATVTNETIKMHTINQEFNAWKISSEFLPGLPTFVWYAADTGLFLCLKQTLVAGVQYFWYNLTRAEVAQKPQDYSGPSLTQLSHSNNSKLASNTLISIEFASPYGTDVIYFHWDDNSNSTIFSSFFSVNLPAANGSHELVIIAFDNVGYCSFFYLIYITDDTLPGISLINPRNNSKIKGSTPIQLSISSGNGTIFYRWDGGELQKIDEDTHLYVPNPEKDNTSHILEVSVEGKYGLWGNSSFFWIVDNSPPKVVYSLENNSIIKGEVRITVFSTEDINLTFNLMNGSNKSIFITAHQNQSIPSFSDLKNGSYHLFLYATDEAQNTNFTTLIFSIYTSAFNWNWELRAKTPQTIKVINASDDLWFILTLASAIDQFFNLSVLPEHSYPAKDEKIEYVIEFRCEVPDEVIFMTLVLFLNLNTNVFPVYQWVHWDVKSKDWVNITTSYNEVTDSWEATHNGFVPYFALINTDTLTTQTSITPGGGQIPSFEIIQTIFSLIIIIWLIHKKKLKKFKSSRTELK